MTPDERHLLLYLADVIASMPGLDSARCGLIRQAAEKLKAQAHDTDLEGSWLAPPEDQRAM